MPTFLHIGCGPKRKVQTTRGFNMADVVQADLNKLNLPSMTFLTEGVLAECAMVKSRR